jgi:hypothetical protein
VCLSVSLKTFTLNVPLGTSTQKVIVLVRVIVHLPITVSDILLNHVAMTHLLVEQVLNHVVLGHLLHARDDRVPRNKEVLQGVTLEAHGHEVTDFVQRPCYFTKTKLFVDHEQNLSSLYHLPCRRADLNLVGHTTPQLSVRDLG